MREDLVYPSTDAVKSVLVKLGIDPKSRDLSCQDIEYTSCKLEELDDYIELYAKQNTSIVNSIIAMAHGMNLKVVAEGVETHEQYKILQEMSCDTIQGYFFSKPVDAASATKLIEKTPPLLFEMK